jgi:hypothetical protein
LVNFGGPWNGKGLYIIWPFGILYGHLVILWQFGMFSPVLVYCVKKKICLFAYERFKFRNVSYLGFRRVQKKVLHLKTTRCYVAMSTYKMLTVKELTSKMSTSKMSTVKMSTSKMLTVKMLTVKMLTVKMMIVEMSTSEMLTVKKST